MNSGGGGSKKPIRGHFRRGPEVRDSKEKEERMVKPPSLLRWF